MNFLGDEFISSTGGFNLGDWGSIQVVYTDPGNTGYYPGGYPGGYPGQFPVYPVSTINWGSILLIALLALVVWKVLA